MEVCSSVLKKTKFSDGFLQKGFYALSMEQKSKKHFLICCLKWSKALEWIQGVHCTAARLKWMDRGK